MKNFSRIMTVVLAGCGLATAQEPAKGRIYIGDASGAPAWVEQMAKPSTLTAQMAANAAWAQTVESLAQQQAADARNASLKADAARVAFQVDPRNRTLRPEFGGAPYARQRGVIVNYDAASHFGLISGDDGRRWPFRTAEWFAQAEDPAQGTWVDFAAEPETGFALFIYSLGPFTANHLQLEEQELGGAAAPAHPGKN